MTIIKPISEDKLFETIDQAVEKILIMAKYMAEYSLYPDDSDVPIRAENVKRRKSIKEFLKRWFHEEL